MKTLAYIFFFLLIPLNSLGQEICDNGIDDDNDGLIDLNDSTDCICALSFDATTSLIPNPSFEDTSTCCPGGLGQMNCAETWIQASTATSDYFNSCDFAYFGTIPDYPIPGGGNGFVGIFNHGFFN